MKILKLQLKDLLIYIQKISLSNSTQNFVSLFAGTRNNKRNAAKKSQRALIAQPIFKLLHTNGVYTVFPNPEVIFRIYLLLVSTNCSEERSFSQFA